jgi:glucosamine kinase
MNLTVDYLLGVDGGGTATRVRLADALGRELARASGGPSGLGLGTEQAWSNILAAVADAFQSIGSDVPALDRCAAGFGLAGGHNRAWLAPFVAADPGFAHIRVATDAFTTLLGAHAGSPGVVIGIGTGSFGEALLPDGSRRQAGGWGFPSGDEASGAWLGLHAARHAQCALDGRDQRGPLADAIIEYCGGNADALLEWCCRANQTMFAELAPFVFENAAVDRRALELLHRASDETVRLLAALDPYHELALAISGSIGIRLIPFLPSIVSKRIIEAQGDSAMGALLLIRQARSEMV